jgi:hypothetical protein
VPMDTAGFSGTVAPLLWLVSCGRRATVGPNLIDSHAQSLFENHDARCLKLGLEVAVSLFVNHILPLWFVLHVLRVASTFASADLC